MFGNQRKFSIFGLGALFLFLLTWCLRKFLFPAQIPEPRIEVFFKPDYVGEEIVDLGDESMRIIVTDRILNPGGTEGIFSGASIQIKIEPAEALQKKAQAVLEIIVNDEKEIVENGKNSMAWIYARDLEYGENKIQIMAENASGKVLKNIIVQKKSLEKVCLTDVVFKDSLDCKNFYKINDSLETETISDSPSQIPNSENSSSNQNSCYHFENNFCWDEVEEQAYDDGYWDQNYGFYGGAYNPPDDCTDFCEDIYEDAYEEGFYDR